MNSELLLLELLHTRYDIQISGHHAIGTKMSDIYKAVLKKYDKYDVSFEGKSWIKIKFYIKNTSKIAYIYSVECPEIFGNFLKKELNHLYYNRIWERQKNNL